MPKYEIILRLSGFSADKINLRALEEVAKNPESPIGSVEISKEKVVIKTKNILPGAKEALISMAWAIPAVEFIEAENKSQNK